MLTPESFHFNEEKSRISTMSFSNWVLIWSDRLKGSLFELFDDWNGEFYLKILKKYRSENAAIPRNCANVILALDGNSNKSINCRINLISIISAYVDIKPSNKPYKHSFNVGIVHLNLTSIFNSSSTFRYFSKIRL